MEDSIGTLLDKTRKLYDVEFSQKHNLMVLLDVILKARPDTPEAWEKFQEEADKIFSGI